MSDIKIPSPDLQVEINVSGSSVSIDDTLTKPGQAADAAAVGAALATAGNPSDADVLAVLLECNALPTLIDKDGAILTDKSGAILLG